MGGSFSQLVASNKADYTSVCIAAKNAGIDSLGILDSNTVTLNIMRSCARQGYHPKYAVQGQAMGLPSTLKSKDASGAYVVSETFPFFSEDTAAHRAFHNVLDSYGKQAQATAIGAVAYSGGALFQAAADAAHMGNSPSPADVVKGLYALPKDETLGGLTPPLNFRKGKPHVTNCYFAYRIGDGKWLAGKSGSAPVCPGAI